MVILRAFLALLAGYTTMAFIVVAATALVSRLVPSWAGKPGQPRAGYVLVNLGYSFLAAAAGGFVTAWAASGNALRYVLVLAVIVLAMGALSALQARGRQPLAYQLALLALAPVGVVAGGLVRLKLWGVF